MSGMPPFKCPANNFTLGPLAPFSKIWNPANGAQPDLDQLAVTWPQIVAIFARVAVWQVTGTISYSGPDPIPDDVFDDSAVTTTSFGIGGPDVTDTATEAWIPSGQLNQVMNWISSTRSATATLSLYLGCPFPGYDGSVDALGSVLQDDMGLLYIGDENSEGAFSFNFEGSVAFGNYQGYSRGVAVSDIGFNILGVPFNLYGSALPGYTVSGTISLTAKTWFGYNGVYDTSTGARL